LRGVEDPKQAKNVLDEKLRKPGQPGDERKKIIGKRVGAGGKKRV
jgi:hypothetical protein